jgi:hypothetical protein
MISRPSRAVSVSVLTCALVLTGCSQGSQDTPTGAASSAPVSTSSASSASTASSTTAAGDEVKGRSGAFAVVPPEGWVEATDQAKGVANLDLVLLSSRKADRFANNLVVISTNGDQSVLEDELAKGKAQMGGAGRTVSDAPARTVAGVPALGFTTTYEQQGHKILARSYAVQRAGKVYLLTLSSSQGDASHAMSELDELLSTWAWT